MSLLTEIRRCLADTPHFGSLGVESAHWRRVALEALQRRAAGGVPPASEEVARWLSTVEPAWTFAALAAADLRELLDAPTLVKSIEEAIRIALRLDPVGLDPVLDALLRGHLSGWQQAHLRQHTSEGAVRVWVARDTPQYLREVGLVFDSPAQITAAGAHLLRLRDSDAVAFLLALELVQAEDSEDPWRMHVRDALDLCQHPVQRWRMDGPDALPSMPLAVLYRLKALGLGTSGLDSSDEEYGWAEGIVLTDRGRRILSSLVGTPEPAVMSLARAMVADASATSPALAAGSTVAVDATVRHAAMVAHELHNLLLPMRKSLERIHLGLEGSPERPVLGRDLDKLGQIADRLERFASENRELAAQASAAPGRFDLASALRDAIAQESLDTPFDEASAAGHPLDGPRQRFVLSIANLLRNAVQSRAGEPVSIALAVQVRGSAVVLHIDDDGPGVPEALRRRIFDNGIHLRPDGTGHGLSVVRQVVEREMKGSITCLPRPGGGSRFELRLPRAED